MTRRLSCTRQVCSDDGNTLAIIWQTIHDFMHAIIEFVWLPICVGFVKEISPARVPGDEENLMARSVEIRVVEDTDEFRIHVLTTMSINVFVRDLSGVPND
jgi:hypothetical protein